MYATLDSKNYKFQLPLYYRNKYLEWGKFMKKNSAMKKITIAIPVKIIAAMTLVMFVLCTILALMLSNLSSRLVERQVQLVANENAQIATKYLEAMQTQSKALATEFARYKNLDPALAGPMIEKALYTTLDDSRIFSAYAAFEPNVYIPETENGISYYAYRSGDSINLDVYNDYDIYSTGDYYFVSKDTLNAHVTEPYSYQLSNGETVWLITISNPIINENGEFLGVANCDILTDTLNNLTYDLNNYKTAYSYIITNNNNYVMHTSDKTLFGTPFEHEKSNVLNAVANGEPLTIKGENRVFGGSSFEVYVPLHIDGISQNWSSAFVVNRSEALSSSNKIVYLVILISVAGLALLATISAFMLRKALEPVGSIVDFAKELGNGNLSSHINVNADNELGDIAGNLNNTAAILGTYISEISSLLGEISNSNLDISVEHNYVGDFQPIKTALTEIISSLNSTIKSIENASEQVSLGASQVSNGAQALSQGATEQAAAVEELSASILEVSNGVQNNASNVHEATEYMEQAVSVMKSSNAYMEQMLTSMSEINQSSLQISKIMKIIDDIAFQTNILALNAAVEAARAGTAGKGFAVVADEVRNLASKSAEAAKQTSALIEGSMRSVSEGSKIAEETAKSLKTAAEKSMHVSSIIEKINRASTEQAEAISQITEGLSQVSMVVQTNSATAEESAAASEQLSEQAENMYQEIAKFKLK